MSGREFTDLVEGGDAWSAAFDYIREANRPDDVRVNGHPYRLYPSGRVLCAAHRPMHEPWGQEPCGCVHAKGETIAEWTMPL